MPRRGTLCATYLFALAIFLAGAWAVEAPVVGDTSNSSNAKGLNAGSQPSLSVRNKDTALLQFSLSTLPAAAHGAERPQGTLFVWVEKVKALGLISALTLIVFVFV